MNNVDKQYLDLIKDILENGVEKETRAGRVKSVFGRMMRFNLKEGLPLLTTKKVFTKGVIHELLWFLSGNTNIKYLVDNNVNIWTDDAYRYYKQLVDSHNKKEKIYSAMKPNIVDVVSKEDFVENIKNGTEIVLSYHKYTFGDLGPVYGHQWRHFGRSNTDQIQTIIDTLKTNPDDRRMLCIAFNPDVLDKVALPPCHTMMQFYTRELTLFERFDWLCKHSDFKYDEITKDILEENNVPKRELSCMWSQRSVDVGLGYPFNLLSYSVLTHMIAEICNMEVGDIICSLGDCHIYLNQTEGINEQLSRDPYKYELPKLKFTRKIENIDDFKFEDIIIENYQSYDKIKLPLSVG